MGVFINYPGEIIFDFGVEVYNKTKITVKSNSVEFFIFTGGTPEEILKSYSSLTGKTFLPQLQHLRDSRYIWRLHAQCSILVA